METNTTTGDEMTTTEFIVMDSCAAMPMSCWGIYRRVALVEIHVGQRPHAIDERSKAIVEIHATWEKLNVGTTDRCAYRQARIMADEMCADENKRLARNARRRQLRAARATA